MQIPVVRQGGFPDGRVQRQHVNQAEWQGANKSSPIAAGTPSRALTSGRETSDTVGLRHALPGSYYYGGRLEMSGVKPVSRGNCRTGPDKPEWSRHHRSSADDKGLRQ